MSGTVLLAVQTPDGVEHAVAALVDVPVRLVAAALAELLVGTGRDPADRTADSAASTYRLVGPDGCPWPPEDTLQVLGVLPATEVRLEQVG